jgi:hypothetical protein
MDYFSAVQEGRKRATLAVAALSEIAGPSYPMLLLKLGESSWTPVGEEMMHKLVPGKDGTAAVVICDGDGNSKAMSGWITEAKAEECSKALEKKGVPVFPGDIKLPI